MTRRHLRRRCNCSKAKGYTQKANVLKSPTGSPVELSLFVEQADPVAEELSLLVESSLEAIGVT